MTATLSERWAAFAVETGCDAIGPEAETRARVALLDLLGVIFAGTSTETGRAVRAYAQRLGGEPEAALAGSAVRVAAPHAAFANSVCGHVLELDDGHARAAGHPGVVVIPAALSVMDARPPAYGELLRAVVLGYELFAVLGSALNPAHLRRGFHTTATIGPLCAALAAGAVMRHDVPRLTAALGLAGLQGAGLLEAAHGAVGAKPFQVGRACGAGVTAAQLAAAGLAGPPAVLEGEAGLFRAMDGDPAAAGPPASRSRWSVEEIYLKRHASCRHTHPPIDVALDLRARLGDDVAQVSRITVHTYAVASRLCGVREPADAGAAAFSLRFLVALALDRGRVGPGDVAAALTDTRLRALAERVDVEVSADLEARYPGDRASRLVVELDDGRRLEGRRSGAVGDPSAPLAPDAVRDKFLGLATAVLAPADAAALADAILRAPADGPVPELRAGRPALGTAGR